MDRQPVESSLIRAVAYDAPSSILRVELVADGATYDYYDVPLSVYLELLEADSKGTFFNDFIKDVYAFEPTDEDEAGPSPSDPDEDLPAIQAPVWTPGCEWPERQKVEDVLGREMATYKARKDEFLATHPGEYVLIHGDEVVGFWPTRGEALDVGYRRFGSVPMLAKKVVEKDRVIFLGGGSLPWRT